MAGLERNAVVTAITTASQLVSEAKKRKEIILTNTGATNLTISIGKDAVAGAGIFLTPYASYYASKTEGFTVTSDAIYVISSAAAGQLSIYERLEDG